MATAKRRPAKLAQASAYFRLAAKLTKAGQYKDAERYHGMAERLVREHQAQVESRKARAAADVAFKARLAARHQEVLDSTHHDLLR